MSNKKYNLFQSEVSQEALIFLPVAACMYNPAEYLKSSGADEAVGIVSVFLRLIGRLKKTSVCMMIRLSTLQGSAKALNPLRLKKSRIGFAVAVFCLVSAPCLAMIETTRRNSFDSNNDQKSWAMVSSSQDVFAKKSSAKSPEETSSSSTSTSQTPVSSSKKMPSFFEVMKPENEGSADDLSLDLADRFEKMSLTPLTSFDCANSWSESDESEASSGSKIRRLPLGNGPRESVFSPLFRGRTFKKRVTHPIVFGSDTITSSEMYVPVFDKTGLDSATETSLDVARFMLAYNKKIKGIPGRQPLSKLKLRALLVAAQGFYEVLYNCRLYSDELRYTFYGPGIFVIPEGMNQKTIPSFFEAGSLTAARREEILRGSESDVAINPSKKNFVALVYKMFLNVSGEELTNKLQPVRHRKSRDAILPLEELSKRFRGINLWSFFVGRVLCSLTTVEDFDSFFAYMREYVSYVCPESKIEDVRKLFEANRAVLEKKRALFEKSIRFCSWPTQDSFFLGFMGHLFFPAQFEKQHESIRMLYQRRRMQTLLAYSARYKNPLALYFMKYVFELMCQDELPSYISEDAQALIERSLDASIQTRQPLFLTGFLALEHSLTDKAIGLFSKAAALGDPMSMYTLATLEKDSLPEVTRRNLESAQPGLALLLKALRERDSNIQLQLFIESGNKGMAYGYLRAGEIYELRADTVNAQCCYKKALEAGQLDAFSLVTISEKDSYYRAFSGFIKAAIEVDLSERQCERLKRISGCAHSKVKV